MRLIVEQTTAARLNVGDRVITDRGEIAEVTAAAVQAASDPRVREVVWKVPAAPSPLQRRVLDCTAPIWRVIGPVGTEGAKE